MQYNYIKYFNFFIYIPVHIFILIYFNQITKIVGKFRLFYKIFLLSNIC